MLWIALIVASYFAGTIPTAMIVARRRGHDPTSEGSGNPGASNVFRVAGARAGAVVFLVDLAKGALPTAVGLAVGGRGLAVACWVAATLGHIFPVTRGFKGGKGVATGGGGAFVLFPIVSVVCIIIFVVAVRVLKMPSAGSLAMVIALVAGVVVRGSPWWEIAATVGLAMIVVGRHRANIERILRGTENPYSPNGSDDR